MQAKNSKALGAHKALKTNINPKNNLSVNLYRINHQKQIPAVDRIILQSQFLIGISESSSIVIISINRKVKSNLSYNHGAK